MNNSIDVAIIGAGPYGLSLAAYLREAKIEFRIFGKTMDSWKNKMPPGMLLKSEPWASSLYDPASSFTLKQYCAESGVEYQDSFLPVPLETYVAYGEAFQARLVQKIEDKILIGIKRSNAGLHAIFDDGEVLNARNIIIAVGNHHFKYYPSHLSHLPSEVLSHSGDYGPLDPLSGKEVIIFGAGASATDLAALLSDNRIKVTLVARDSRLPFMPTPKIRPKSFQTLRKLVSPLKPIKRLLNANSGIGNTWLLKVCAEAPWIIHSLPEEVRIDIVQTTLGPLGHWSVKDRVEGQIPLHLGRSLESAEISNGKVILRLSTPEGAKESLQADHLIAATGYKMDLKCLEFLKPIITHIHMKESTPILTANYESSIPGLYFIGPVAANSFGPVCRFVFGAIYPARNITKHILKKRNKTQVRAGDGILSKTSAMSDYTPKALGAGKKPSHARDLLLVSACVPMPYRVLRCAQASGANIFVLGTDGAKGLKRSRYCKAFIRTDRQIDGNFDAELAKQINDQIETFNIDVVLPSDPYSTRSLILIRDLLNAPCFPMPDLSNFDLLNNKWRFYLLCKSFGIKCPNSKLFQNTQELIHEIGPNGLASPQIAKPLSMENSMGVIKLMPETYQKQLESISYHPIMLQDFIEGEDIGASVFCRNGKITSFICHKLSKETYYPFFDQKIYNDISEILGHLKVDGIFNFDMRRTPDGQVYFLECNPRVFWKIAMSMLAGVNFISSGLSNQNCDFSAEAKSQPTIVRFPKAILLQTLVAPWTLGLGTLKMLKYLYSDPIPYFCEVFKIESTR